MRTFSDTYVYAGGVFGSVNKPDKHAEEATHFALQVIKGVAAIEAQIGQKIEVIICLNTGGPLVAGVVSLSDQMKLTGVPTSSISRDPSTSYFTRTTSRFLTVAISTCRATGRSTPT